MKTYGISNELKGKVVFIREGAVNCSLGIELPTGDVITSSITMESLGKLGLKIGDTAYACIKATDVIVAAE
ncbi:MAG: TOBE domain-containing protein [Eggerthellaceae bacterium]|nr:TOBE domain-containing protein [Eggerthellaceae bacterium]